MKNILLTTAMLVAAAMQLFAQAKGKEFKLEGRLKGAVMDSVYIQYHADNKTINEKQQIKNGIFNFSGRITEPGTMGLRFTEKDKQTKTVNPKNLSQSIFIDKGLIKFSGDLADLSSIKISGSQPQTDWELYQKMSKGEKDFSKQINQTYDFMVAHPKSYISAYLLNMYSAILPIESILLVYNKLSPESKQGTVGKSLQKMIASREATAPGKMAMDFSANDAHGNLLTLSAFRGKYVLLDFWASWCVPCRHSHPHLINLYNKYKDKGFDIIGIASDMGREAVWKEAIEKDNVGIWHHVLEGEKKAASKNDSDSISNQYGVAALPTKILIDPKGKIIGRYTGDGGNELDIELSKIFK